MPAVQKLGRVRNDNFFALLLRFVERPQAARFENSGPNSQHMTIVVLLWSFNVYKLTGGQLELEPANSSSASRSPDPSAA